MQAQANDMVLKRFRQRQTSAASRPPTPVKNSGTTENTPSTDGSSDEDDTHLNRMVDSPEGEDISTIVYGESVGSVPVADRRNQMAAAKAAAVGAPVPNKRQSSAELDAFLPNTMLSTSDFNYADISVIGGSMDEVSVQDNVSAAANNNNSEDNPIGNSYSSNNRQCSKILETVSEDQAETYGSDQRSPSRQQSAFEENIEVFKYSRRRLLCDDRSDDNDSGNADRGEQGLSTDMSVFCLSLFKDEHHPQAKSLSERIVRDSLVRHFDLFTERKTVEYITEPVDATSANAKTDPVSGDPDELDRAFLGQFKSGEYDKAAETLTHLLQIQRKMATANTSETLSRLAVLHLAQGHLNRSNIFAKEALRQNREECYRQEAAVSLMMIGLIYFRGNKVDKALSVWKEAMQAACAVFGYDHPYIAVLLNNLGCLHYQQANFAASLRSFSESLDLQKMFLKSLSGSITDVLLLDIATTKGNMAIVLSRDGDTESSMSLLEETLSLQESVLGHSNHFVIEQTRYNMERLGGLPVQPSTPSRSMFFSSSVADKSNVTTEGARLMGAPSFSCNNSQAKAGAGNGGMVFGNNDGIPMRRSGADSSLYAMQKSDSMDFLEFGALACEHTPRQRVRAAVLEWFGKRLEDNMGNSPLPFVPAFDGSRRKRMRVPIDLDRDNVVDAELYLEGIHAQAQDHLERNEIEEVLNLFVSVLSSHVDKYGEIHHLVGTAHHNIGLVYMFAENYSKAQESFERAAEIRRSALESDHPDVASSLTKIALIHSACRNSETARDTLIEVSETLPRVFGYNSIHVARALNNLAVSHYDLGAFVEATRACREAKDILTRLLEEASGASVFREQKRTIELSLARTLGNLGFLECRRRRNSESVSALKGSLELRKRLLDSSNGDLKTTNRNLAYARDGLTTAPADEPAARHRKGSAMGLSGIFDGFCSYGA